MECDSVHSTIERQIRGNVYTPSDYTALMLNARRNPFPYTVEQLTHPDFEKLSDEYLSSIRPGRVAGDATVSDIRGLLYEPSSMMQTLCTTPRLDSRKLLQEMWTCLT